MSKTEIEWADESWNPVRGCVKVSPGCRRCYAEAFAERWRGVPGHPYEMGFDPRTVPEKLHDPLRKRQPTVYFVNSMSDLFGEFVPDDYVLRVFGVMASAPRHVFKVLTKRAARMERLVASFSATVVYEQAKAEQLVGAAGRMGKGAWAAEVERLSSARLWPLPNVQLGVSWEDHKYGNPRLEHLRRTPAATRIVSFEPLLEDPGEVDLRGIDGAIAGAESGPRARPMETAWVRGLRDRCAARPAEDGGPVDFMFKQELDAKGHKVSLPLLDGQRHAALPEHRHAQPAAAGRHGEATTP